MYTLLMILGIVLAGLIAWQDFRDREIHAYLLGLFGLLGGFFSMLERGLEGIVSLGVNGLLVSLMLASVWLIFRLKDRQAVMDVKLGWGDVVMLYALACWWEPMAFLTYYSISVFGLSLVFVSAQMLNKLPKQYPIPLAGALAISFALSYPFFHPFSNPF
ncbi:MAG: hypothetical protein AAFN10_08745 [Bacteroidota bacterium]